MIMSRTPLRVTFVGGGTDLPQYFIKHGPGAVVSATVNKYIHIMVNRKFDNSFRISYSTTEIVDKVDKIKHPSVREALKLLDIRGGIEVVSISDVHSRGTGLGSSSTFLVGLLNALHAYLGEHVSPARLASEAVKIEREILGEPGGLQDQYIAAFGGLRVMKFMPNGSVSVDPVIVKDEFLNELQASMMLLYTGVERNSGSIHVSQSKDINQKINSYDQMKGLVDDLLYAFQKGDIEDIGKIMDRNWNLKRELTNGITDGSIDDLYRRAIDCGAFGGKLIGAGGGGFLMFIASPEVQSRIEREFRGLRRVDFKFDFRGSRIEFVGD